MRFLDFRAIVALTIFSLVLQFCCLLGQALNAFRQNPLNPILAHNPPGWGSALAIGPFNVRPYRRAIRDASFFNSL